MEYTYLHKRRYVKRIPALFGEIDKNDSNKVSVNEFFELIDLIEKNPFYQLPMFPDIYLWDVIRRYINKYLKFKQIAKNPYFELFMLIILLGNCVVIIWGAVEQDEETLSTLDLLDDM